MSRRSFLIGLLVICVVAGQLYLLSDYLRQSRLVDELSPRLQAASQALALLPKTSADQAKRLDEAKTISAAAKEPYSPAKVNGTEALASFYDLANKVNVKMDPAVSFPFTDRKITENTYSTMRLELSVLGNRPNVVNFLQGLEDKKAFPALAIEKVTLDSTGEIQPGFVNATIICSLITLPGTQQGAADGR